MNMLRRKIERALGRAAARLDAVNRRNEDIALSAILTSTALSEMHDPVAFVMLLRECFGPRSYKVTDVKRVSATPAIEPYVHRFQTLLDVLADVPPVDAITALKIGRIADRYHAIREPVEMHRWAGDVGLHFRRSSSFGHKGRLLTALVRLMRSQRCIEVGTAYGMSALFILSATSGQLDTIEVSEPQFSLAQATLKQEYPDRVTCHFGRSRDVMAGFAHGIDFLFHDGGHSYEGYTGDFAAALPLLEPGAVVLFDDIRWEDFRIRDEPARTYEGWRAVVSHSRVLRAVEIDGGLGLMLLGE
jgi:predicted O-methyltransferase YrrM